MAVVELKFGSIKESKLKETSTLLKKMNLIEKEIKAKDLSGGEKED